MSTLYGGQDLIVLALIGIAVQLEHLVLYGFGWIDEYALVAQESARGSGYHTSVCGTHGIP
jgi:hypothetical protein